MKATVRSEMLLLVDDELWRHCPLLSTHWTAHQLTPSTTTVFTSPQLSRDMQPHGLVVATSLLVFLVLLTSPVLGCNEAVCASIVSKCMLLQSCKCDLHPDCTCCKVSKQQTSLCHGCLLFRKQGGKIRIFGDIWGKDKRYSGGKKWPKILTQTFCPFSSKFLRKYSF